MQNDYYSQCLYNCLSGYQCNVSLNTVTPRTSQIINTTSFKILYTLSLVTPVIISTTNSPTTEFKSTLTTIAFKTNYLSTMFKGSHTSKAIKTSHKTTSKSTHNAPNSRSSKKKNHKKVTKRKPKKFHKKKCSSSKEFN